LCISTITNPYLICYRTWIIHVLHANEVGAKHEGNKQGSKRLPGGGTAWAWPLMAVMVAVTVAASPLFSLLRLSSLFLSFPSLFFFFFVRTFCSLSFFFFFFLFLYFCFALSLFLCFLLFFCFSSFFFLSFGLSTVSFFTSSFCSFPLCIYR